MYITNLEIIDYIMRRVWFFMIVASIIVLIFNSPEQVVNSMVISSTNAIDLLIKLLGIYAIWLGIIEILDKAGLSTALSSMLSPIIDWLFGDTDKETKNYIALNLSTNTLGLGNACTPMGIKAMQKLDQYNSSIRASHQMIMLMIINATSIQLLPTTVISLRATNGSLSPSDIILPSLIATAISTAVGVAGVKIMAKITKKKGKF